MSEWKYNKPEFECDKLNYDLLTFAPWSGHRNFVYDFIEYFKPNTVVELGSHYGCSAFTFAQADKDFELGTNMFFVDTWQGDDFTKKYDNDVYTVFCNTVKSFYSSQNINMLRMTFDEANDKFEDNSIDVLHIDGSHYYNDVKRDFETWRNKVKENGVIMLHDVSSDIVLGDIMGSHKFWLELKKEYKYTVEFDFSWGLGIIFLNKKMYKDFTEKVDLKKYQRINNALDVEFKDILRKNYFTIKDKDMYISDLLKQKDILNSHLEEYKKNTDAKDKYIEERNSVIERLIEDHKADVDKLNSAYEDLKAKYSLTIDETIKAYEDDKKITSENYANEKKNIICDYEKTISAKDAYIKELEKIKEEKIALEEVYHNTINYKFGEIKRKIKK